MLIDPSGNIAEWIKDIGRFIGGAIITALSISALVATAPLSLIPGLAFVPLLFLSSTAYGAMLVASPFSKKVKNDMELINWNPLNNNEESVLSSNAISFYKGEFVIRADLTFIKGRSFSCGIMFLHSYARDLTIYNINVVRNEWGHFVQLGIVGLPKFFTFYALPSMLIKTGHYYSMPWERSADIFGGVDDGVWGTPYLSSSDIASIIYLIGVVLL